MKISITNERELKSAKNHITAARERLSKVIDKLEKRNIDPRKLHAVYSKIWEIDSELSKAIDETEITIGGI